MVSDVVMATKGLAPLRQTSSLSLLDLCQSSLLSSLELKSLHLLSRIPHSSSSSNESLVSLALRALGIHDTLAGRRDRRIFIVAMEQAAVGSGAAIRCRDRRGIGAMTTEHAAVLLGVLSCCGSGWWGHIIGATAAKEATASLLWRVVVSCGGGDGSRRWVVVLVAKETHFEIWDGG